MNFKEIKELIEILDQSSLTEINIEDNKGSVVNLKKEKETEIVTPQVTQQPTQPINHTHNETQQKPSHSSKDEQSSDNEYNTINAPMVGTFYNYLHQMKKHTFKLEIKLRMKVLFVY